MPDIRDMLYTVSRWGNCLITHQAGEQLVMSSLKDEATVVGIAVVLVGIGITYAIAGTAKAVGKAGKAIWDAADAKDRK